MSGLANQYLAKRLLRLRRMTNLSLPEAARAANISKGQLWQIEQGRGNPTLKTIERIARFYGCTASEVISPTHRAKGVKQ